MLGTRFAYTIPYRLKVVFKESYAHNRTPIQPKIGEKSHIYLFLALVFAFKSTEAQRLSRTEKKIVEILLGNG